MNSMFTFHQFYLSSPPQLEIVIPSADKGDMKLYEVTCLGNSGCRDIGINLIVATGDADLYAR